MKDNNKKPFVLYLDTGYKFYISEIYQQKLELLSQRYQGEILTFGAVGEYQFGNFQVKVFRTLNLKLFMFLRSLFYGLTLVRKRRKKGLSVDLVACYDPLNTGLMGVFIAWMMRLPLSVELNGDYTAESNYQDIKNPILRKIKRIIYIRIEAFVLSKSSGIKLMYPSQLDYFLNKLRQPVVKVFPNFLDVSHFYNISNPKKFSIVGFPFAVKGIDIAVKAFKLVSDDDPSWTFEILGWYPDEEMKLINSCIDGHPKVSHLKPISREEMATYVGNCGVVVCASRTEGFPRIIKEAMRAGKPCIVSDVGGLPIAIKHGENGLLFRSENVDELADCMRSLMVDASYRKKLGAQAAIYSEREYSLERYLDQLDEFYKATIANHNVN